jgi:DNA-binding CsgD family transcriptional regulator
MAHSQRLRVRDVRAVFQLVGECRELGYDYRAWQQHMIVGLRELLGAPMALAGEFLPRSAAEGIEFASEAQISGAAPSTQRAFLGMLHNKNYLVDPLSQEVLRSVWTQGIWSRQDLANDQDWYHSNFFEEFSPTFRSNDAMASACMQPGLGWPSWIALCRPERQPLFATRQRRLLRLFHQEIAPLVGAALAPARAASPSDLSGRLRQTLTCLLRGDSEKQAAAHLEVSAATVHVYVKALYRHFRVSSRGELLAYFLRRAYPHI